MNRALLRHVLGACRAYWLPLAAFLVVGISQSFVGQYSLVFFQRLLDAFISAHRFADLAGILYAYAGLTLGNHALIYLEGYPYNLVRNGSYMWAKLKAMEKLERIDYLAYRNLSTGQLIQVVENGAAAFRNILNGFYLYILRNTIPSLVISFALIHYYDRTLFGVIAVGYVVLYVSAQYLIVHLRRQIEKMLASQEDLARFSTRALMELVVFRVNGRLRREYERVRGISDEIVRAQANRYLLQEIIFTGFAALVFLLEVVVVIEQAHRILAGVSTVGTLVALVMLIRNACYPISGLSMAYVDYRLDVVAFERLLAFLALPEDRGLSRGEEARLEDGRIELRDVSFAFAGRPIFRNLNLTLPAGQRTALVGASGAGKSTLVELLLGLLKPDRGQVLIAGQDLARVSLQTLYRHVAYIPQEAPVFDGTIRENLTLGGEVGGDKLAAALTRVGLDGLLAQLPAGLNTLAGERGAMLSGGERQRLAFARLLVQDPRIVVMDEPASALDSVSESLVTKGMADFLRGRTVILIAHPLQMARDCERIVVLDGGQIVQDGTFADLVATPGKFRELWEQQTAGGEA